MQQKDYVTVGIVAIGALGLAALASRSSSTRYGADPNAVANANAIVAAHENDYATQLDAKVKLAALSTDYAKTVVQAQRDMNIAVTNGATQRELAQIASDTSVALSNNDLKASQAQYAAQLQETTVTAGVAKDVSNNEATIAQRNASASKTGSIMGFLSSLASFFSGLPANGGTVNMNGVSSTADLVQSVYPSVPAYPFP